MKQFIIELVSNASTDVYPDNSLSSFTNFLPEQVNLDGDWEVALMEILYPSLYHNVTDGTFRYKEDKSDKDIGEYEIPAGLYTSLDHILQAMEDVSTKSMKMTWNVNNSTQKVEITLPSPHSGLVISSPDIAHILGFPQSFVVLGATPFISLFPIDIIRVHSLMLYTDIIAHGVIGDTTAPLLRCFPFISKIKGDELSTTQFMNYRCFENLLFKKLSKKNFHSISIDLRDTTGKQIPFAGVGITRLTLLFRKVENHF